jgi:hypothetical protein
MQNQGSWTETVCYLTLALLNHEFDCLEMTKSVEVCVINQVTLSKCVALTVVISKDGGYSRYQLYSVYLQSNLPI